MSNASVRVFLSGRSVAFLLLVIIASFAGAGERPHSRYPNELRGFRFYGKYLAPLEPGISSEEAARQVLGDTAAVRRNDWTIHTSYTTKGGLVYNSTLGKLAEIALKPDGIIPMVAVKFSPLFAHCHASVSEINISFDVYRDTSGLEYLASRRRLQMGKERGSL